MSEKIKSVYNRKVGLMKIWTECQKYKIIDINSLTILDINYNFNMINWKLSELKKFDRNRRKLLTRFQISYIKANENR